MTIYGFRHRAVTELPNWSINLKGYYWLVRVNSRNKTTKRKNYRLIAKEKLRLVETGIDIEKINAVCKYLVSLKQINVDRLELALKTDPVQMSLPFF